MKMPKLLPIPIETKNRPFPVRVWRWMTSIRKWQLLEDWQFTLPDNTIVIIPKGFIFDGASIPRPLWGLLAPIGLLLIPALIHDFAYRYDYLWAKNANGDTYKYKEGAGRKFWDQTFKQVGEQVNGMALIDTLAWLTLVCFGKFAWNSNHKQVHPDLHPV